MEYQIKNIFMEKSCRKYAAKDSPDLFKILVNNPKQPLHPSNSFKRNPVPFNRQAYKKQKEPETTDHSLFRLQNKFRKIPLLVMLSDQV